MENSSWISLSLCSLGLLLVELVYFKIADRFNIIDKPNERSSHNYQTIRGGGVIFLFGLLIWFLLNDFQWPWFVFAAAGVAVLGFVDDLTSLNVKVRSLAQLAFVALLFYQLWPLNWPPYLLPVAIVFCVGTLNAFNFMDGINGITGIYALVTLIAFMYIDQYIVDFTNGDLLNITACSVVIFLFFNFRKRARCFAGDVGSVTIALILIFTLLQLIVKTNNFLWPLLFLVYGVDSIVTIIFRLRRKENIFKAHRTHLYQYLSNEMNFSHRAVSAAYGIVQGLINTIVICSLANSGYVILLVVSVIVIIGYLVIHRVVIRKMSNAIKAS
ncbi:UDP-GlcNAc--UDP-phosphate GlcNAc-1-phosphate transferase [Cytophagales bacterium WSM2-2]|nr:UDP-GlcNAc--UDP-phosphate GlcNAc-1-phosphate transferase [Cytophagales bacterium WSM2-2]